MWREALAPRWRAAVDALRGRAMPAVRRPIAAAWRASRRRPDAVLAAVVMLGVAVMILHWS